MADAVLLGNGVGHKDRADEGPAHRALGKAAALRIHRQGRQ